MIDRRIGMDELGEGFGSEVADALEAGRFLEAAIDASAMELPAVETGFDAATEASGGFADRVMTAIADEPAPAPAGFLLPLRRSGFLRGLGASVRQAWVVVGGAGRPALGRVAALAYVLAAAIAGLSITGAATIGAAGALGMLGPSSTQSPAPTLPAPTLAPPTVTPQLPQPSPTLPPSTIAPPSPSPSSTDSDDHGNGPEASDDHGGSSGSDGGGDDNSGPGSSSSGSDSGSGGDSGS